VTELGMMREQLVAGEPDSRAHSTSCSGQAARGISSAPIAITTGAR
jgi:hypothetical protein